jgi:2-polyprenyl-6-methoxyphenol hydroxylase-like FAD-dependent oxidoreductase
MSHLCPRPLHRHGPTPEALKEYEAVRAPRVHGLQNASTTMAKKVCVCVCALIKDYMH